MSINKKLPSLDGLRGISILLVLFAHSRLTIGFPLSLQKVASYGGFGVQIFFVLSGFLISYLMKKEESEKNTINIFNFYLRRIFKILPVYLFYLLFLYIQDFEPFHLTKNGLLSIFTFTVNFNDNLPWNISHFWTLSVEEQFYFIWPFLFVFFKKYRVKILIFSIFYSCIIRGLNYNSELPVYTFSGFFIYSDAIALGALGGIYYFKNKKITNLTLFKDFKYQILSVFIIILCFTLYEFKLVGLFTIPFNHFITSLCILYIIISVLDNPNNLLFKLLNTKLLALLGIISYSLYIWQQFFLNSDKPMIYKIFPLNLILICSISIMSYYLIEKPILKFKYYFKS